MSKVKTAIKDKNNLSDVLLEFQQDNPGYLEFDKKSEEYQVLRKHQLAKIKAQKQVERANNEMAMFIYELKVVNDAMRPDATYNPRDTSKDVDTRSQTSSNRSRNTYTPTEPKMGGLIDTYQGPEAWTGGKPKPNWKSLDITARTTPLPTQIRSNSSKAAASMLKRTEGLFSDDKSKFQHGDDLDYFCLRIESHFEKHGLDTIAYRFDQHSTEMMNLFKHYPKFTVDVIREQNETKYNYLYDDFDNQNDKDAIECFMNSISEELRKELLIKSEENMKFSEMFMIFVENERPQSGELYDTIEKRVLSLDISNYSGANIKDMAAEARKDILALEKANAYDSKHNAKLCRLFTEAGGANNTEYITPMYQLLDKVKRKVTEVSHLNNQQKLKVMSREKVGWNDILKEAEENYKGMTIEGNIRWPAACNTSDLRAPATNFGANLMQTMGKQRKFQGKKSKFKKNGNGKPNGGKYQKKEKQHNDTFAWKTVPPLPSDRYGCKNGAPWYKRMVGGKLYHWCAKCGENGLWTLSHPTGDHNDGFKKNKRNGNRSHGQVNIGEGLVPDARIWLAEYKVSSDDKAKSHKKQFNQRRKPRAKNKKNKNKSKTNDMRELVLVKDRSTDDSSINQFSFWIMGLTMIGYLLKYQGFEFGLQYLMDTVKSLMYMSNKVIGKVVKQFPWYLWAAPILWISLIVVSVRGRNLLHMWYPEETIKSLQPELRSIRRHKERYWKRFNKKRSKFLQKFNNKPMQIDKSRQDALGKRQVRKELNRYRHRNAIYHQKRSRGAYWKKQRVRKLRNARAEAKRQELERIHRMYRTYYERRVNQLVDRRIQELIDKYDLKQKTSHSSKDNYMSPAENKIFATIHNIVNDSESDSTQCSEEHNDHTNVNMVQGFTTTNMEATNKCDWKELDQQFDNNEQNRHKYCDPKFRIDYPEIERKFGRFDRENPDWEDSELPVNNVKKRNKQGEPFYFGTIRHYNTGCMQKYRKNHLRYRQQKPPYAPPQHMIYSITDIDSRYDMNNEQCWGNIPIEDVERDLRDEIKAFGKVKNNEQSSLVEENQPTSQHSEGCTNMEFLEIYKKMCVFRDNEIGKNSVWTTGETNNSYMARWSAAEPTNHTELPEKCTKVPTKPKPKKIINGLYDNSKHWTKVILQHPTACTATLDDSYTVVWDSGASLCISNDKRDFIGSIQYITDGNVDGINGHLKLEGVGTVCWTLLDSTGNLRNLKLPAYYAPEARQRLLSTTVFCNKYPKNNIVLNPDSWIIHPNPDNPTEQPIDILINPINNLPMSTCMRRHSLNQLAINFSEHVSTTHRTNFNLSEPQKEILRWHYRLGHIGMRTVQFILRTGALAGTKASERLHYRAGKLVGENLPKCAACQFGKQINRSKPGKRTSVIKDKIGALSAEKLHPGQRVFIDHFECPARGRKFGGTGIKNLQRKAKIQDKDKSYGYGCIFIDAATGFINIQLQSFINATVSIQSVKQFENDAKDHGVIIKEYHSDNGSVFTSQEFRQYLMDNKQTCRFGGAGSHHQNGRAERGIRTIMAMARTMMLHAGIHWADVADATLWPMAVTLAVYIYNRMPNLRTGLCPLDLWSKTRSPHTALHDLHVFGCPAYVLQKALADGKSIPRWTPRSDRGRYVGRSPNHAGSVPLILNLKTGYITPQWNVVMDDWFATVPASIDDLPDFHQDEWARMFGTSCYEAIPYEETEDFNNTGKATNQIKTRIDDTDDLDEEFEILQNSGSIIRDRDHKKPTYIEIAKHQQRKTNEILPTNISSKETKHETMSDTASKKEHTITWKEPSSSPSRIQTKSVNNNGTSSKVLNEIRVKPLDNDWIKVERRLTNSKSSPNATVTERRDGRPRRNTRIPERLNYDALGGNLALSSNQEQIENISEEALVENLTAEHIASQCSVYLASFGMECNLEADISDDIVACLTKLNELPPHAFAQVFKAGKKKNPDILSYDEVMKDYDNLQLWLAAALKEIKQLENKNVWVECKKEEANGEQIVPCTWVFRYKRNPAGVILKCKARICLRGDLMIDDSDSYAPVVAWSTIRFFLIMALHLGWCTISVDWVNAFPQAVLDKPIFMQTPRGFMNRYGQDGCLKLLRSLYGSKFAPKNWYTYLRKALLKLGLRECPFDKCLFHRPGFLMILYVDDAGIAAPNKEDVYKFVEELRTEGFDLEIEGEFTEYLGIGIEELSDGSLHMSQQGLIEKIIKTTKMTDCNPNWTPTTQVPLGSDPDGELFDQVDFNYASIVGMLLYAANNTRPDITFAVSQVARFTAAPKVSHARAIKTIVRYLARNPEKGLIIRLNKEFFLKCWVDADFAGLYGREPEVDPKSVKSRYGYVIEFGGVPLLWKSQLISEICLSTTHAEYVGLTNAMRTLIPLRNLIVDTIEQMKIEFNDELEIICEVFEDNQSAYLLATNQQLSVRTKYFCIKYHFFWQFVYHEEKNPEGWLHIGKCSTDLMNADYMTKGLVRVKFETNRKRVQGW